MNAPPGTPIPTMVPASSLRPSARKPSTSPSWTPMMTALSSTDASKGRGVVSALLAAFHLATPLTATTAR